MNTSESSERGLFIIEVNHQCHRVESYLANGISLNIDQTSLGNSSCWGIYFEQQQIGFTRVTSNYATFTYPADDYFIQFQRGKSLS